MPVIRPGRIVAIFAIIALMFLSIAIVGCTQPEPVAALNNYDIAEVAAFATAGFLIGAPFGGVGAPIGFAIGAVIGLYIVLADGAIEQIALEDQANNIMQEDMALTLSNLLMKDRSGINGQIALAEGAQYYFVRMAENAAWHLVETQNAGDGNHTFNWPAILDAGRMGNEMLAWLWSALWGYDQSFDTFADVTSEYWGDYEGCTYGTRAYMAGFGEQQTFHFYASTPARNIATASESNSCVVSFEQGLWFMPEGGANTGKKIWIQDTVTGEKYEHTITSLETKGTLIELATGDAEPGVYALSTDSGVSGRWLGIFDRLPYSDVAWNAAAVQLISTDGGSTWNPVAYSLDNTNNMVRLSDGSTSTGNTIFFNAGEGDGNMHFAGYNTLDRALTQIWKMEQAIWSVLDTTRTFAETYYDVAVEVDGSGTMPPAPDIVFPDLDALTSYGADLDTLTAIYRAYLSNLDDWFYYHSIMEATDLHISLDSLQLVISGDIIAPNGTTMASNEALTPFLSLENQTFTVGADANMTQPCYAIIWTVQSDGTTSADYLPMGMGWHIIPQAIAVRGESVGSYTLEVFELEFVLDELQAQPDFPRSMSMLDWLFAHWYLLAIAFGVVVLLGAILTGNLVIALIGLVALAAGCLGWALMGEPLLGFTMPDLPWLLDHLRP